MTLPLCFGVWGHPISHSRSPAMHQAAFAALGLPHRYLAFDVEPARLAGALAGAAALGFGGVNLTVPLKTAALVHLEELTPEARAIGAVNTVCFTPEGAVGHNTDGDGFVEGLMTLREQLPNRAVILGGGGAARAVVQGLASRGCSVTWVSRGPERLPKWPRVERAGYGALHHGLERADVLVNATTVGMRGGPRSFPVPIDASRLPNDATVVDLVYPRPAGGLLDQAAAHGLAVQDGLPMLWGQGVLALERWLGRTVPAPVRQRMGQAIGV